MARAEFESFAKSLIRNYRRVPMRSTPPAARCLVVKKVEPGSLADRILVGPGDFLVSINGQSAALINPKLWRFGGRIREYIFFSPATNERIELTSTAIDPGCELGRTPEMINATYKPDSRDPEPLLELWEAGAWADLLRLSEAALKSGAANSPILPIYGAALCESGRQDEGLDTMVRFLKEFARGWTVNYRGLAFFYLALEKARSGDMNAGAEILARSFQDLPKERVANAITALGLPRPKPIVLWEGNQVPGDYELSSLDSPPVTATMSEELARLPEGSIFLLCLLGNYRGNGPYNQFMAQYRGYVRDFAPFVGPLHVITEMRDRYAERPHYFEEEDKALAEKAPFRILFDPEGEQGTAFGPSVSPFVMALDRTGRVLVEGEMEGMDLWRALLSANS